MKRVFAVHLLNDFSGSPLVFRQAIEGLLKKGYRVELLTSGNREGFLSGLSIPLHTVPYRFFPNSGMRLIAYLFCQFMMFFKILRICRREDLVYVNTLLPFGAALAARMRSAKVVYHLHESYIRPPALKGFLKYIANGTASKVIYVSEYLWSEEGLPRPDAEVIYNALPDSFISRIRFGSDLAQSVQEKRSVLMVCSLKVYKGIPAFIDLAGRHPKLHFDLVLNASEEELRSFFAGKILPKNLQLFPCQTDLHPFYQRASVVVNLTNPDLCVETFGMTLLEAMAYGKPVIAPAFGGPCELVSHGKDGFTVDPRRSEDIDQALQALYDQQIAAQLSAAARRKAASFRTENLQERVSGLFLSL